MKLSFLLLLVSVVAVMANAPEYSSLSVLRADGAKIKIAYCYASPLIMDWDNDGVKDLLVGKYALGKMDIFINEGTNSAPRLVYRGLMQAGGSDLAVSYG